MLVRGLDGPVPGVAVDLALGEAVEALDVAEVEHQHDGVVGLRVSATPVRVAQEPVRVRLLLHQVEALVEVHADLLAAGAEEPQRVAKADAEVEHHDGLGGRVGPVRSRFAVGELGTGSPGDGLLHAIPSCKLR